MCGEENQSQESHRDTARGNPARGNPAESGEKNNIGTAIYGESKCEPCQSAEVKLRSVAAVISSCHSPILYSKSLRATCEGKQVRKSGD